MTMTAPVDNPRVKEWIDRARAMPLLETAQRADEENAA